MFKRNLSILIFCAVAAIVAARFALPRPSSPASDISAPSAIDINTVERLSKSGASSLPPGRLQPSALDLARSDQNAINSILVRFTAGDYFAALRMADDYASEKRSREFHRWLEKQMPALLTSAGWAHLKLGNCSEAIVHLRRAEVIERTPETAKGLAYCYRKTGNLFSSEDQARWLFERFPNDRSIDDLYLDILESLGEYEIAVEFLEKLLASTQKNDIALDKKLKEMRNKAQESIHVEKTRSQHFVLSHRIVEHANLPEFALNILETSLSEFTESYGFIRPKTHIEVYLYRAANFSDLVPDGPQWAEGLFDGRIRIPIREQWLEQNSPQALSRILRHELVHALFAQMTDSRTLPAWFDEGVAQRLACGTDTCLPFQFLPKATAFLAKEDLERTFTTYAAIKADLAYRQSLYLIQVVEYLFPNRQILREIIGNIGIDSTITSDAILSQSEMNMDKLIEHASNYWQNLNDLTSNQY